MATSRSPLWKQVFDDVERRVGRPLAAVTSSAEFQATAMRLLRTQRSIVAPVQATVNFGLHLVGLPSNAEVRKLRRDLTAVQRDVLTIQRTEAERDGQEAP